MIKRILLMGFIAPFLLLAPLMAQEDRATITGAVTDTSGAVVPGVTVTATNVTTRVQTTSVSNDLGLYQIRNLVIGEYTLSFTKSGFQKLDRSGITLVIAQVAEINVQLQVGAVTQTIEVTAAAPILESETNELGSTIGLNQIADLPLSISSGRDASVFAYDTIPGVEGGTWDSYISGTQAFSKEILIDGTLAQASETGSLAENYPSMEAVQEFKVDTGGNGGSAGMYTSGGTFMYTLKSGTNKIHGSAYGFLHNEDLNSNTWTNNYYGLPRGRDREEDYGFSAGGPIIIPHVYDGRNKTFFFAAFEQYRLHSSVEGAYNDTVPTAAFLEGNFGALLTNNASGAPVPIMVNGSPATDPGGNPIYYGSIFNPATGLVIPGNNFANVTPTPLALSTISQNLAGIYQKYYPPQNNGIVNNDGEPQNGAPFFHQNQMSVKIDENFNDRTRLAASVIYTKRPQFQVGSGGVGNATQGPWSWNGLDDEFGGPLSLAQWHDIPAWGNRISLSHNFSPNIMNVVSATWNRFWVGDISTHTAGNWQSTIGFTGIPDAGQLPAINYGSAVNGVVEDNIGYSGNGFYDSNSIVYDDKLDWVKGRHTVSFGAELRWFECNSDTDAGGLNFNFSNVTTGAPNEPYSPYVGFGFASFLLGEVNSASEQGPQNEYGRRRSYSVFAADSFKLNQRITLNYGVNWNFYGPLKEKYGHWANFNTTEVDPVWGIPGTTDYLTNGSQSFEGPTSWKQFAPHLGAAIKVTNKLVVRSAYSMFIVPIGIDYWGGVPLGFDPGYWPQNIINANPTYAPVFQWDPRTSAGTFNGMSLPANPNGYPGTWTQGVFSPEYLTGGEVSNNPNGLAHEGIVNEWNAGIEYQVSTNTRFSVNYLANRGTHLHDSAMQSNQPDQATYTALVQSGNYLNTVNSPATAAANGVPYPYAGFSGPAWSAIAPFPQVASELGSISFINSPYAKSGYDALQMELIQRFSHGITADYSFNLARFITNGQNNNFVAAGTFPVIQNIYNESYAANDIKPYNQAIIKGYIQWALPFGRGREFLGNAGYWTDKVVSGWSLGSVMYFSTGTPMGVTSSNSMPGYGSTVFANVASGASFKRAFSGKLDLANPADTSNQYLNVPASTLFTNPAEGSFGNDGPYTTGYDGFGTVSTDLSIIKVIRMRERYRIQLRGEFYDVMNRHYWNNPNNSISSPYFGMVQSENGTSRIGQVGLRIEF